MKTFLLSFALCLLLLSVIFCNKRHSDNNTSNADHFDDAFFKKFAHDALIIPLHPKLMKAYELSFKTIEQDDTRAINRNPKLVEAYVRRSWIRLILKDYKGSLKDAEYAEQLDPKKNLYFIIGEDKESLNDHPGAIISLTIACTQRANVYQKMHNYKAALKNYNYAITLNPGYGETYKWKGELELEMKNKNDACSDFQKALKLGDKSAEFDIKNNCN